MLVAKVVDDFFIAAVEESMQDFLRSLDTHFKLGKSSIEKTLKFLGCIIEIDGNGGVSMSMRDYLEKIKPSHVSKERKKQQKERTNER